MPVDSSGRLNLEYKLSRDENAIVLQNELVPVPYSTLFCHRVEEIPGTSDSEGGKYVRIFYPSQEKVLSAGESFESEPRNYIGITAKIVSRVDINLQEKKIISH
jgi:hypothetical protein